MIDEYGSLLKKYKTNDLVPEERLTRLLEAIWSREYYEKINVAGSFAVLAVSFRNEKIHGKIRDLYRMFKNFLVREFSYLNDKGVISTKNPTHTAEIIMTMIEGSRHFRAFIIEDDQIRRYNHEMILAARHFLERKD